MKRFIAMLDWFYYLTQLGLVVCKLLGVLSWSWWWITMPTLVGAGLVILTLVSMWIIDSFIKNEGRTKIDV